MRYLIRDGKVEFSGNKKEIIKYVQEVYPDDYWLNEYGEQLEKDHNKLKFALECLGLFMSDKAPKRLDKKRKIK